jgi:diaminopimelate epimerase
MKFEKWTALGNDYLIVEAAALAWELTPERIKRICNRPFGVGSDGILLLIPVEDPRYVAELRIFNADGSEAELSGNGARQAALYLRHRGWTGEDEFTITTKAGEIKPTIRTERDCTLDLGRARTSPTFHLAERMVAASLRPLGAAGASSMSRSAIPSAR